MSSSPAPVPFSCDKIERRLLMLSGRLGDDAGQQVLDLARNTTSTQLELQQCTQTDNALLVLGNTADNEAVGLATSALFAMLEKM